MEMTIKDITAVEWKWVHQRSGGTYVKTGVEQHSFIEGYDSEKFKELKVSLSAVTSFDEANIKTVYFDKTSGFPRESFKHRYPGIKLVKDPGKADAVIVNIAKLKLETLVCEWVYLTTQEGEHIHNNQRNHAQGYNVTGSIRVWRANFGTTTEIHNRNTKDAAYRINNIMKYEGRTLVDESCLELGSAIGKALDKEQYTSIEMMLGGDGEMVNLGMSLLVNFDYEQSKLAIATLLQNNYAQWSRHFYNRSTLFKTMIHRLRKEFPGFLGKQPTELEFWGYCATHKEKNELVDLGFTIFMRKNYKALNGSLQIVFIPNQ